MFFFLPIGVEDHTVDRVPWVSILIAGLCGLVFFTTWVLPAQPEPEQQPLHEVVVYWLHHPYLTPPPALDELDLPKRLAHSRLAPGAEAATAPAPDVVADEQRQLELLAGDYELALGHSPLHRFGLVPARGPKQVGWLTYMFLHLGWLHILGNLLFFYIVGPLLEDSWGRPLFLAFYLIGGLVAGLAQVSLNPASTVYIVGASGAIAACMGAFSYRFARRKIRMAYLIWLIAIFRGTFRMPAWLWGAIWFAGQYFDLKVGGDSSVAVMAHVGGFAFGFAVAMLLGLTRLEAKIIAPAVAGKVEWTRHPALGRAELALANDDVEGAERQYRELLHDPSAQRDAELGLAQLALRRDDRATAAAHLARVLAPSLAHSPDSSWQIVEALGANFHPEDLPPSLAFRLANALQTAPEGLRRHREPLLVAAAAGGGALGAKALLQAAQLRVERNDDAEVTRGYLARARSLGALPEELVARIAAVEAQLPAPLDLSVPNDAPPVEAPPLQLQHCRLRAIGAGALELSNGYDEIEQLALTAIQAVAVGIVPIEGKKLLVIDLILAWASQSAGPVVRRLQSDSLAPQRFIPNLPARQGFTQLVTTIADASGATLLPDAEAARRGAYQTFADLAAFEAAIYASL